MATNITMMEITTNSSMSVKPNTGLRFGGHGITLRSNMINLLRRRDEMTGHNAIKPDKAHFGVQLIRKANRPCVGASSDFQCADAIAKQHVGRSVSGHNRPHSQTVPMR